MPSAGWMNYVSFIPWTLSSQVCFSERWTLRLRPANRRVIRKCSWALPYKEDSANPWRTGAWQAFQSGPELSSRDGLCTSALIHHWDLPPPPATRMGLNLRQTTTSRERLSSDPSVTNSPGSWEVHFTVTSPTVHPFLPLGSTWSLWQIHFTWKQLLWDSGGSLFLRFGAGSPADRQWRPHHWWEVGH